MGDQQQIYYDHGPLRQAGRQITESAQQATTHLQACDAQVNGYGQWWNPDNDQSDMFGSAIGGCFSAAHKLLVSTGQKNFGVLGDQGQAIQTMADNSEQAENATTRAMPLAGNGGQ
jgi:hypothetical protein